MQHAHGIGPYPGESSPDIRSGHLSSFNIKASQVEDLLEAPLGRFSVESVPEGLGGWLEGLEVFVTEVGGDGEGVEG